MNWTASDTWIVLIAALCAMSCALLGNFLVLRRMSMMGDAISHAVLPGLAVAFLITGTLSSVPMFIGAMVVGVLTALFTQWVHSFGKVDRGASLGVVFTTLFAIGLILISRIEQIAPGAHIDSKCVLYGDIVFAADDKWSFGGVAVPRPFVILAGLLIVNSLIVLAFWKELKLSSFDPELATTLGINATAMHYLLMTMVAVTTVAAFEVVGSILVIAMLIVPAAAAHLLTDRLGTMIGVSLLFAVLCAVGGHVSAIVVPPWLIEDVRAGTTTAGMMAVSAGLLFVIVMFAAPRHGVLAKLARQAALRLRIVQEDVLGLLYRVEERKDSLSVAPLSSLREQQLADALDAGPWMVRVAVWRLTRHGKLSSGPDGLTLAAAGREQARAVVRTHRLWESYLHEHLPLPADHVHAPAEQLEHVTDAAMQRQLAAEVAEPSHDPHGKRVPPEGGD
jgi:manganese/zinc/iron transport system permease protein